MHENDSTKYLELSIAKHKQLVMWQNRYVKKVCLDLTFLPLAKLNSYLLPLFYTLVKCLSIISSFNSRTKILPKRFLFKLDQVLSSYYQVGHFSVIACDKPFVVPSSADVE